MTSMPSVWRDGERPPRLEFLLAAVAVGYSAGYSAGTGKEVEQAIGAATVSLITWLWSRRRQ
ncbi:hypothetical protein ABT093_01030 [Kitasatospora sp. NPDC002551]|uniref:hypothetical protein n=1 Tax=Kitasatospora sp. NPDC002551 TaxID=3154539 RepID=UPI0033235D90